MGIKMESKDLSELSETELLRLQEEADEKGWAGQYPQGIIVEELVKRNVTLKKGTVSVNVRPEKNEQDLALIRLQQARGNLNKILAGGEGDVTVAEKEVLSATRDYHAMWSKKSNFELPNSAKKDSTKRKYIEGYTKNLQPIAPDQIEAARHRR